MDTLVDFNLRGTIFRTLVSTAQNSGYLVDVINKYPIRPGKPYFIDRSARLFDEILNFLVDSNYKFERKYKHELDFYQIKYDESRLTGSNERFKFNLRGTIFETTKETIEKSEFLRALINGKFSPPDDNGAYFIDRSAKLFDKVLNFLSDPNYEFNMKNKHELDFYCVNYEENDLYNGNGILEQILDNSKILSTMMERYEKDLHNKDKILMKILENTETNNKVLKGVLENTENIENNQSRVNEMIRLLFKMLGLKNSKKMNRDCYDGDEYDGC